MARNDKRMDQKSLKKDQTIRREVLNELDEATDRPESGNAEPQYEHPNRDQARGDWDRSNRMDE
jgi:hypothetical protein